MDSKAIDQLEEIEKTNKKTGYDSDKNGTLYRLKGVDKIKLANFNARITEEITEDDGVNIKHSYAIQGETCGDTLPIVEIPASKFASLNWLHEWGNRAIIEPGQTNKDYVRHSIQVRSNGITSKTFFTHTGWRKVNNQGWVYLTANGAIGGNNVSVRFPRELQRYNLPVQPEHEVKAIKASLSFLDIGKREITLPLWSYIWLAPLTSLLDPMPNFSAYIQGETGLWKTTLALVLLAHFGLFSSVNNLSNFDDTVNALEKRAFTLKDSLLVIDDYHPAHRRADAQHKEALAQRIIRAYSNRTGRGRLASDTSDKGRYEPRGMLLITGEEIVSLQSTLARIMPIEISQGDISREKLSEIQRSLNLLRSAMCSYITWIRNHIQPIKENFPGRFIQLRDKAFEKDTHKKLPEQIAFLQFALDTALSWISDLGVLSEPKIFSLANEGWDIFTNLAVKQKQRIEREDPVGLFESILQTLVTQGKVRIEDKDDPGHERVIGGLQGDLIGYYDDCCLYLLPPALWQTLQRFCLAEGSHFPFSKNTFYRILAKRNRIKVKDDRNVIPEWIRGKTQRVLKFTGQIKAHEHGTFMDICGIEVRKVSDDSEA